jgi:hypothetical protein
VQNVLKVTKKNGLKDWLSFKRASCYGCCGVLY